MTIYSIAEDTLAKMIAAVQADLDDLLALGVKVAVTAEELVAQEAAGFVVDIETGAIVEPMLPLEAIPS